MPIREYLCSECNLVFEQLESINEPPSEQCPECLKRTVHRIMSVSSFKFKEPNANLQD